MPDTYISDLNAQATPASADLLEIEQVSDSTSKKVTLAQALSPSIATAAQINTGTSNVLVISPDAFAGSRFGIQYIAVALNGSAALTTADAGYFRIPIGLTGMNLVSVTGTNGTGAAGSSSSGNPTITVTNVTDGTAMLSTSLTIDATEYTSATAVTPAVIDTTKDDIVTDDLIKVAVTTSGTGTTYVVVTLGFQLP
jgi:hypothetical protein